MTNYLNFQYLIPYVQSLSDQIETARLLYEYENGRLYYGDELREKPGYTPLSWLDPYRNSADDTLQEILENILDAYQGDILSTVEIDLDEDGEKESLSVMRYAFNDISNIYQLGFLVRETDASILTGFDSYVYEDNVFFYLTKDEAGEELLKMMQLNNDFSCNVGDVTITGVTNTLVLSLAEWVEYMEKNDIKLLFSIQGEEMVFPQA